jgi:hypothetical protein
MTLKQLQRTLLNAMEKARILVDSIAPERSGELKLSIKLIATGTGYEIKITAPHMKYTEEKWISPQWNGRANPNEGWFREAVELVFRLIRAELNATGSYEGNR